MHAISTVQISNETEHLKLYVLTLPLRWLGRYPGIHPQTFWWMIYDLGKFNNGLATTETDKWRLEREIIPFYGGTIEVSEIW